MSNGLKIFNRLTRAAVLAMLFQAMPPLGQQTQIAVRPGSGVVKTRDRGYRHTPRLLNEAARSKHAAKMKRRYVRWDRGLRCNPCVTHEQVQCLTGWKELQ